MCWIFFYYKCYPEEVLRELAQSMCYVNNVFFTATNIVSLQMTVHRDMQSHKHSARRQNSDTPFQSSVTLVVTLQFRELPHDMSDMTVLQTIIMDHCDQNHYYFLNFFLFQQPPVSFLFVTYCGYLLTTKPPLSHQASSFQEECVCVAVALLPRVYFNCAAAWLIL